MDKMDYIQMFDLKPEELSLQILICSTKDFPTQLQHATFIKPEKLPILPFSDQSFDLVLCLKVLFINDNDTESFHQAVLMELARVGGEVRVSPVMSSAGVPSKYLGPVIQALQEKGLGVELRHVDTTVDKGSSAMLRLWSPDCLIAKHQAALAQNN